MKRSRIATLFTVIGCVLAAAAAQAQIDADALKAITTYEFGQSREPLTVVADQTTAARLASPEQKAAAAAQLAGLLGTDATKDCKQFVCRQLAIIGDADCVPALAALLEAPETADMARYALERIRGPEAGGALRAALESGAGCAKIGIVNSLGARECPCSIPVLQELATGKCPKTAAAAVAALGKIGGPKAAKALAAAKKGASAELARAVSDAQLVCAEGLLANGKTRKATRIYKKLFDSGEEDPVRVAAFLGLVKTKGDKGVAFAKETAEDADAAIQEAAKGVIARAGCCGCRGCGGAK